MRTAPLLPLLGALLAGETAAEIFRCDEPDGSARFVGDPAGCTGARPHVPAVDIVREPGGAPASPAPSSAARTRDLDALLPEAGSLTGSWDATREAPSDPARDPDFVRWGVVETAVRHYGRALPGGAEVCTVELWGFRDEPSARAAAAGFSFPGWVIHHRGSVLVMVRGTRWQRGGGFRKGLFPDCRAIGQRVAGVLRTSRRSFAWPTRWPRPMRPVPGEPGAAAGQFAHSGGVRRRGSALMRNPWLGASARPPATGCLPSARRRLRLIHTSSSPSIRM